METSNQSMESVNVSDHKDVVLQKITKLPTIEDFEFIKPISRGAFGKVFLGYKKQKKEKLYAIKVMKKSDLINKNLTSQVVTERDAMAKSTSPFVVQLYYSIESKQNIFLIMEYLIGGDVKSLLGVAGYFDEAMAIMYIAEVTLALQYLHNKGIIHRDLKPDNMLVTATGHIKLTDFGLSKLNMSFNQHEVPMTPRTPKTPGMSTHNHQNWDSYRTPGQILSLKSSLAFSTGKFTYPSAGMTTPGRRMHHTPLSEISSNTSTNVSSENHTSHQSHTETPVNIQTGSHSKLIKQMSMRDMLLSQSTSKYLDRSINLNTPDKIMEESVDIGTPMKQKEQSICNKSIGMSSDHVDNQSILSIASGTTQTPTSSFVKPPVKRLMSTLQASINWSKSTVSETSKQESILSNQDAGHVQLSRASRPIGMSLSCLESFDKGKSCLSTDISMDMSDSVFDTNHSTFGIESCDNSQLHDASLDTDIKMDMESDSPVFAVTDNKSNSCKCQKSVNVADCSECRSHLKAPSRQENITDDTPQMHRSEESVWNSYAAKNLRSLRHGSYSEDSEENEAGNKENTSRIFNVGPPEKPVLQKFNSQCNIKLKNRPRRLIKTKSFCYPSDEESDSDYTSGRYNDRVKFARKRSFYNVEQSPVRRTHSADSGLTQDLRLLWFSGVEPNNKRSNSVPRTRIRFHSGNDKGKMACDKNVVSHVTCLKRIADESKSMSDSDRMATLSADEKRLVEGHSDTSATETEKGSLDEEKCNASEDKTHEEEIKHLFEQDFSDSPNVFDYEKMDKHLGDPDPVISCARNAFPLVNRRLNQLNKPMVSSLNSESDVMGMNRNLSSIKDLESDMSTHNSTDMNVSVFASISEDKSVVGLKGCSSQDVLPREPSPPRPPTHIPLLPPPRVRRASGKKTPGNLKFCSTTTCIPYHSFNESRSRNDSGRSDVARTPDPVTRNKVTFLSNIASYKCPQTPKTPLQSALLRSQSMAQLLKTPYRTPKSAWRAPPPQEEERILGTPDYLAPEILQPKGKRHGPSVDWWALGICMFEFLTGVPPFNDETPDKVFENILTRDIPWPEGDEALSPDCRAAIEALLTMDPTKRPHARDVRKMQVFCDIDWNHVLEMEPQFVPAPDNQTDTSYFEARNNMQELFVSDVDF